MKLKNGLLSVLTLSLISTISWATTPSNITIPISTDAAEALFNRAADDSIRLTAIDQLTLYNRVIAINPRFEEAYVNRSSIFADQGKTAQAKRDLDQALKLDPGDSLAWNNRGILLSSLHEYKNAMRDFKHALQINPKLLSPYLGIGHCLEKLKDFEGAILSFTSAIKIEPRDFDARRSRALMYLKTLKPELAMRDIQIALTIKPYNQEMVDFMGAASELRHELDDPKLTKAKRKALRKELQVGIK